MYLRILKKDLKRKKTMNVILLLFIILAAMFVASSVNNMISVTTAVDGYFEKANVPDYWFVTMDKEELERYGEFADDNDSEYGITELIQINPNTVLVDGEKLDYANTSCISTLAGKTKVFDKNDNEITHINDGEIYVTAEVANSVENDFSVGSTIEITDGEKTKTFIIKGTMKDAMFGSSMIGMTRFLISDNDFEFFKNDDAGILYSVNVYTDNESYYDNFLYLQLNTVFNVNKSGIKLMYMMDMIIAAIFLVVSICLILISMVILRFTINFTMSEEFREIGVMKAIGLKCRNIRQLYIIKYLAISIAGAITGFILSIPFGNMMLKDASDNIIIDGSSSIWLNGLCAVLTVAVVVLFCFMCTAKIKKITPIDAIRNGQSGERFKAKSRLSLGKSRLKPAVFMAANDVFSSVRRFVSMILIFSLGLLLIVIPANTANTIQSDGIIKWFNMAECDNIMSIETVFTINIDKKEMLTEKLDDVKNFLKEKGIEADVFQEAMFRVIISKNDKRASSLAFQGLNGVTCTEYDYLEGEPPKNSNEVAVTKYLCENIDANIGDYVYIKNGNDTKKYIITATYQSMNNMGEGIRFYEGEELNYDYVTGAFGIQIRYKDEPTSKQLDERKKLLEERYTEGKVYTAGEYINYAIGDVAGKLGSIKKLILIVVAAINMLVTVLMVKSFITKEKNEIALLKSLGFKNGFIIGWQTIRIGIVILISVILASVASTPLSKLIITPIFKMMGAENIKFQINPLESYVLYPLVVLAVTMLSAMITSLQVRKINTSEISNIE